ncbi:MAG: elongation factor Tu [Methanomassiliicoccus sp.]|nr:MAG: elongation factor Tu [Methanomassiliicoccus sp.]
MSNLTVAILGSPEFSKGIGKKSTESDMTFYDVKKGETTLTCVEPTKYPDRLSSLFHVVSMADCAVLVVDKIDHVFGECVIMLDCAGVKKGWILPRNYITKGQFAPFIKDTALEQYPVVEDEPVKIRELLLEEAEKLDGSEPTGASKGSVPIDHYFDVKGVGTVILGRVADGHVRKHDSMKVLPTDKQAIVRSIQKHDDDYDWAVRGDRVGLALKGVSAADLDRGMVLSTDDELVCRSSLKGKCRIVKYWPSQLKSGMVVHVGHWMQFSPARVDDVSTEGEDWRSPTLTLTLQKDLVFKPGSRGVVAHLEGGKLRVIGTIELS